MEKNELKSAIKEYNKVIVLETPVNHKSETAEKDLYEALEAIEPEDEFSDATLKVFAELRAKYDKKTKPAKEVKTTVKAGQTVEMVPDKNEIKIEKKMKEEKEAGKPAKKENGEVKLINTILSRGVKKDELMKLIDTEEVFDKKKKKELKAVSNFMQLKSKMLGCFDQKLVDELRAELPPINHTPKAKAESKPVKENPIVNGIKSATKVKQLKTIAKANEQFNWKKLKKLEDFEKIQDAMLKPFGQSETKAKVKAEPAKPKMVPNPLIAEINAFSKLKKLIVWAKEREFTGVKKIKKYEDIAELKSALIAYIPAEIEVKGKTKAPRNKDENVAEKRREFLIPLLKEGAYTRPELKKMLDDKFGADDPKGAHPHSNMLSEIKNEAYYKKHNLGKLVEESKSGKYRFVK